MSRYTVATEPVEVDIWVEEGPTGIRVLSPKESAPYVAGAVVPTVKKETSLWQEPSWGLQQLIAENARKPLPDGRLVFDFQRYVDAQIRFLLKGWTLSETDPELKLNVVPVPRTNPKDGFTMLSDPSMDAVRKVKKDIVDAFVTNAVARLYSPVSEELEGAIIGDAAVPTV